MRYFRVVDVSGGVVKFNSLTLLTPDDKHIETFTAMQESIWAEKHPTEREAGIGQEDPRGMTILALALARDPQGVVLLSGPQPGSSQVCVIPVASLARIDLVSP